MIITSSFLAQVYRAIALLLGPVIAAAPSARRIVSVERVCMLFSAEARKAEDESAAAAKRKMG